MPKQNKSAKSKNAGQAKKAEQKKQPAKAPAKGAAKPAAKGAASPVAKPVAKPAAKPAAKTVAPVAPAVTKPVPAKPASRPRMGLGRGLDSLIVPVARKTEPASVATPAPVSTAPVPPVAAIDGRSGSESGGRTSVSAASVSARTEPRPPVSSAAAPAASAAPDAAPAQEPDTRKHVLQVKVSDIERCPWQPRENFNDEQLAELSDSIRVHGVIQPLVCRRALDGTCQLIAGERRLRAAIAAGLDTVPVVMVDADDRDAAEMTVIENIQRADLNVIEEAEGYRTLSERFGLTQQEVSERVGKARASIANSLRLLDLPDEVKQMLGDGRLSSGHGKVLLGLPGENEQIVFARRSVQEGLTVRALEKMLEKRRSSPSIPRSVTPDMPDAHRRELEDLLHRHFGAKVSLVPGVTFANGKRAHGRITIDFFDNDELNRIIDVLGLVVE